MNIQDSQFANLLDRVNKYKRDILFEEPCPLYEIEDYLWDDYNSLENINE